VLGSRTTTTRDSTSNPPPASRGPDSKTRSGGAVSHADRTPAAATTNFRVNFEALPGPGNMPILVSLFGNPKQKNEQLTASKHQDTGPTVDSRLLSDSTVSTTAIAICRRWNQEPCAWKLIPAPSPAHSRVLRQQSLSEKPTVLNPSQTGMLARFWTLNLAIRSSRFTYTNSPAAKTDPSLGLREALRTTRHSCVPVSACPGTCNGTHRHISSIAFPLSPFPHHTRFDTGLNWRVGREGLSELLLGRIS